MTRPFRALRLLPAYHDLRAAQKLGLLLGPLLFLLFQLVPAPPGLAPAAWQTAAVGLLMAVWWITEALPIPATALLPIALFPVLGIAPVDAATAPYANPIIFLFMGGFLLATGMQVWNLHRRLALSIVRVIGTQPSSIIFGFMVASAFLSMWVSNTSTALMMLPIAISVLDLMTQQQVIGQPGQSKHFEIGLLLCIAYGCSIGGLGTLIGTPPNALLSAFMLENYGYEIGFAQWMLVGVPMVVVLLPLSFVTVTRLVYPVRLPSFAGGKALIDEELARLGPMSRAERRVALVFCTTAALWITRPLLDGALPGLSDTGIAMAAALTLFVVPSGMPERSVLLDWEAARTLPWGVLLLFGGGLSLAGAISSTGLAAWIGSAVGALAGWPLLLLVLLVVTLVIFLTEITSNTATAAAFLPVLASVAVGMGQNPLLFAVPAVLASSSAFMLPVATPPNAIVYSTGHLRIAEMSKAGFWLNLLFIAAITLSAYALLGLAFGVAVDVLPEWVGR